MMYSLYTLSDPIRTDFGYFDPKAPIIGERKVSRKTVAKRRARNKSARLARRRGR